MIAFSAFEEKSRTETPNYVVFSCRLTAEEEPIKLGVPFRALEEQVEERMSRIDLYKDLPRGRKRRGWKKEFLESLTETAKDIGEISEEEILRTVRAYRKERRAPEITVASEKEEKARSRRYKRVSGWSVGFQRPIYTRTGPERGCASRVGRERQFRLADHGRNPGRVQGSS
jgi:hypothetical protein